MSGPSEFDLAFARLVGQAAGRHCHLERKYYADGIVTHDAFIHPGGSSRLCSIKTAVQAVQECIQDDQKRQIQEASHEQV